MKKIFFMALLCLTTGLYATTLSSQSEYMPEETITIKVNNLEVHDKNWLGIYALNDTNDWNNVLRWIWTGETTTGSFSLKGLPQGEYEARVFYNNSFQTEAKTAFLVKDQFNPAVDIETRKDTYEEHEFIEVKVENMSGHAQDWVAIYPKGSSNEWENVIAWRYTNGLVGTIIGFEGLNAGEYEVRAFFKNSYKLEAKHAFSVGVSNVSITPKHPSYYENERVTVEIKGFSKNQKDWIGIYPTGSSNDWENVVAWEWVEKAYNNGTIMIFDNLPVGKYETRGFFKNSFNLEAKANLEVKVRDIPTETLIKKAQAHCLEKDNSTTDVLCANDGNTVYILDSNQAASDRNLVLAHYKVTLNNNSLKLLHKDEYAQHQLNGRTPNEEFIKKFDNSPIYVTKTLKSTIDRMGVYRIHANDKRAFSIDWYERNGVIDLDTLKVSEDGKKLYMSRTFLYTDELYIEVYDIEDLNNIKLHSREIINTYNP